MSGLRASEHKAGWTIEGFTDMTVKLRSAPQASCAA